MESPICHNDGEGRIVVAAVATIWKRLFDVKTKSMGFQMFRIISNSQLFRSSHVRSGTIFRILLEISWWSRTQMGAHWLGSCSWNIQTDARAWSRCPGMSFIIRKRNSIPAAAAVQQINVGKVNLCSNGGGAPAPLPPQQQQRFRRNVQAPPRSS